MHLRTARRLGLVGLVSVALALPATASVASTSTVDVPQRSTAHRSFSASDAASSAGETPDITKLSFQSSATYDAQGAYVIGQVASTGDVFRAKTEVRVDGVYKGLAEIFYNTDYDDYGFRYKSGWGAGKVVLGPTHIETTDGEQITDTTKSGVFRIRYGLNPNAYYSYGRSGNKITLKAVNFTMFKIRKYVTMGRTVVQVKTSKGWKDKKVLKLAGNGNSPSYTFKASGKKYYRLKVTTNDTRQGFVSEVVHV